MSYGSNQGVLDAEEQYNEDVIAHKRRLVAMLVALGESEENAVKIVIRAFDVADDFTGPETICRDALPENRRTAAVPENQIFSIERRLDEDLFR